MLLRRVVALAALLVGLALPVRAGPEPAEAPPPPADERPAAVTVRLSVVDTHDEGGGEGNPFLDEDLTVIEPVLLLELPVSDATVTVKLAHDYVSSASIARLDNYPSQSGASADYYFGAEVGVSVPVSERVQLGARLLGAFERDYRSAGLGLDAAWESADRNTRLSAGAIGYYDTVTRIRFNGRNEGSAERITLTLHGEVYRVLTPWLHGALGYSFSWQEGFLETNINAVVIEAPGAAPNPLLVDGRAGVEVTEELPELRRRHTVHGRLRAWLPTDITALELGGRLYADSWGLQGWSLEPMLFQWLVPGHLLARLRYRWYRQEGVEDFQRRAFAITHHRTQDPDLAPFDSHAAGLKLIWYITPRHALDGSVDYVWRSDDLDQLWVSVGLRWEF